MAGKPRRRKPRETVVYGTVGESLIFIPRKQAEELATVWAALGSRTWGELRSRLSRKRFEKLKHLLDRIDFDTFYEEQRKENPRLTRKKALEAYRELEPDERLPLDDEPCCLPDAVGDGDWPEWPAQEMLKWMPENIPGARGEMSFLNGPCLTLDPAHEAEIVAAVEAAGYRCIKEERLVRQACGYTGE
jgi:hypothetical protein